MARSNDDSSQHRKLALVIGNGDYSLRENRLDYSRKNAQSIANLLEQLGFDVKLAHDLPKHELTTCIIDFSKKIEDGDLVVFYFCGHACYSNGDNYLIPVCDNQIVAQDDMKDFANKYEHMVSRILEKNESYVTILIFDCAKSYLTKSTRKSKSLSQCDGLVETKPSAGTIVQFARSTNQHAKDNNDTGSYNLYFRHLLNSIAEENVDIADAFQRIDNAVRQESKNTQKPVSMNGLRKNQLICLNLVVKPVEKWDEIKPSEMASVKKKQTEMRACYDNFPSIDDLTKKNKPSIARAEKLTQQILSQPPSGDAGQRDTACHVLHKLFEQENQECLFFDSTQNMTLHDASGSLADFSSQEKPFVLKLNNVDGLGDKTYADDGQNGLNAVETLDRALQQNESHPVIEDITERLAKAHNVDKKQINIQNFFHGSCNVIYTVDDLPRKVVESLPDIPERLKQQFEQFQSAKIHPLLFRPSFDISQFDERGNKVFENQNTFKVGPPGRQQTYIQPGGWARYGLKVLGRYGSDDWLHPFGNPGNWYKAYHGTGRARGSDFGKADGDIKTDYACVDALANIHAKGFQKARVHVHGEGVYCSPDPTFPDTDGNGYVRTVKLNTKQGEKHFRCMLQVAVNPDGVTFTSMEKIWLVQDPKDIRTYGILIREA
ncbi:hypothetical protein I4U23_003814 [Adineta vaga]|nr:hypothetical protein I4U23_003814 [Adineta vaga]